jgi:prepilin peptidase CpaA
MSDLAVLAVGCSGALAAVIDLRTRRVPNVATASVAAVGVGLSASGVTGHSVLAAVVGLMFALVLMLPGHLFGATGAGDVKLFAALGTLLGPASILKAFLYTAIAGGLLAAAIAMRRRRLAATVQGVAALVTTGGGNAAELEAPERPNRFAYAPAIAVGTLLAALGV